MSASTKEGSATTDEIVTHHNDMVLLVQRLIYFHDKVDDIIDEYVTKYPEIFIVKRNKKDEKISKELDILEKARRYQSKARIEKIEARVAAFDLETKPVLNEATEATNEIEEIAQLSAEQRADIFDEWAKIAKRDKTS
jgi:hypothetical protein